jgi:hypothetical protein
MLSGNVAAHALARFTGGIVGSQIYLVSDFKLTGIAAGMMGLVAFVIMWRFISDYYDSSNTMTSD